MPRARATARIQPPAMRAPAKPPPKRKRRTWRRNVDPVMGAQCLPINPPVTLDKESIRDRGLTRETLGIYVDSHIFKHFMKGNPI